MNTYLGPKGYTLWKHELNPKQMEWIKKELTVKPYVPGSPLNHLSINSYPVYRESEHKFYVPRYFGEHHFGAPKEFKLPAGTSIDVTFQGDVRDYQKQIIQSYMDFVQRTEAGGCGLLEVPCGQGKTVMAIHIFSQLKTKTLVLVHKEFLMNQWMERIQQFVPQARIGRIQGQIVDIEDKDIVLGMIQSLSMKEYPTSLFETFGLTIVDEVHHISSEVFSNTLFKIVTKYMLGLSATMTRKDGTTFVFKMFLGDIIYKGTRDATDPVTVRAIDYKVDDAEFNEMVYDYRGNPQYSSMIVKLCEYNRRSEFILQLLRDMMEENPAQQIIVLAHNKSLLKYLHDAIAFRNIADGSVGYYIGGMKEPALKISETKKIIIATYSMAAEALDIKSLTTLVMATPKTDIEQSVGRILREKHAQPLVVDIIDSHDLFQNQWCKRKVFYKTHKYKILHTTFPCYTKDTSQWTVLYNPQSGVDKEKGGGVQRKSKQKHAEDLLQGTCFLQKQRNQINQS